MLDKNTVIGVIGAGAMGAGIAQVAATAGHQVLVFDTNTAALERAKKGLQDSLQKLIAKGKITAPDAEDIQIKTQYVVELKNLKACGLVIEAVIEDLVVKQQLFAAIEAVVDNTCVLASNTSSLSITSIASACKQPERFLGVHFFNPATLMPLVEIIPGLASDETIVQQVKTLITGWGKATVLAKDTPGFIVNRVARSFYGESIRIYEEGIADMPTIDWAMRELGGFRMGPFELMDFIGNDINYKVTETVWEQFFYEPRFKPSLTQKRLYESKRFGRKTGRGYYDYSEGAVMPEPTKNTVLGTQVLTRVLVMLINEAVDSLYLQVATKEDLDTAMLKGVNYPKGLLQWADDLGLETVLNTLQSLYAEYAEDRYRPSVLLKRMVTNKQTFYGQ